MTQEIVASAENKRKMELDFWLKAYEDICSMTYVARRAIKDLKNAWQYMKDI